VRRKLSAIVSDSDIEVLSYRLMRRMSQLDSEGGVTSEAWNDLSEWDKDFYRHCVCEVLDSIKVCVEVDEEPVL
jgi:hypothetical protein